MSTVPTWLINPVFTAVFNTYSGRPHLAMKQKHRDDELRKRWTIRALEPCWGSGIIYRIQILLWRSILIRILPKEIRYVPKKVRFGSCAIIPDPTWPKSSGSDPSRLHRTALPSHQFFLFWNVATCRLIDCWVRVTVSFVFPSAWLIKRVDLYITTVPVIGISLVRHVYLN
jgi:hypothetical protein